MTDPSGWPPSSGGTPPPPTQFNPSYIPPPPTQDATPATRGLAIAAAVLVLLASFTPYRTGSKLTDDGWAFVVYALIVAVLLGLAALDTRSDRLLTSLSGGTSVAVIGSFGFVALTIFGVHVEFDSDTSFGIAFYALIAAIGCCVALAVTSLKAMTPATDRYENSGITALGTIAAVAIPIGLMLPPLDYDYSFTDRNFDWGVSYLQVGWLLFVGLSGMAGVIGFLMRSRRGAMFALGGLIPVAWSTATSLADEAVTPFGFASVHPLLWIAVIAEAIAVIAVMASKPVVATDPVALGFGMMTTAPAWVQPQQQPQTYQPTVPPPPQPPPPPPPPRPQPAVAGSWAADPFARHQYRFYDGRNWTAHVSDNGVSGVDPPENLIPPPPPR